MNNNQQAPTGQEGGQQAKTSGLPPWMQAEQISIWEKLEIMSYKVITYIPVLVTFGVFTFLFIFYMHVSRFCRCLTARSSSTSIRPSSATFTAPSASRRCGRTLRRWSTTRNGQAPNLSSFYSAASIYYSVSS